MKSLSEVLLEHLERLEDERDALREEYVWRLRPEQKNREDQNQPRNLSQHQEDDRSEQVAQDAL